MGCPQEIVNIWETVKDTLRDGLSATAFDLWYGGIVPADYDPATGTLRFRADSEFKCSILTQKYKEPLEKAFADVADLTIRAEFYADRPAEAAAAPAAESRVNTVASPAPAEKQDDAPVRDGAEMAQRSRYTFDNFIIGESNKFARSACWAVANASAVSSGYNPLFIYGPSGVGKTHLMYAVINEIRRNNPAARVIYTKGDDFINYMVACLTKNDMATFRSHFRTCDVLMIDDIQFIAGKEGLQEELFHTFDALFDEGKQIILASDRPPKDIQPLEDRLRSRFEQGLMPDINPPDLELRNAIIRKKAEDSNIDIPAEVLSYLAENLRSNIRQIEGVLKKLAAKSLIEGRRITMELARDCIKDFLGEIEPLDVVIDKIFAAVYKKYNIPKEEILGSKRTKEIMQARHVAIYLIRNITELALPKIGKLFGRDHSTVMASIENVKKKMVADPLFAGEIENMKNEVVGR